MDHSFPNSFNLNFGETEDYQNTQYYENSQFFSNPNQDSANANFQTSQNTETQPRVKLWDVAEDIALMSDWSIVSQNRTRGKNQKKESLWTQVKALYVQAQKENPGKIGDRNKYQMKGRYNRLSENAQKWVGAYQEAYRRKRSGMSKKDIENEAHKIYEVNGNKKFLDLVVFNEVMCKMPKWSLEQIYNTTRQRPVYDVDNEESGGSTKRSRTSEKGDYSNPETPTSGGTTSQRPTGRDADKRKGKGKVSNEIVEELREMRLTKVTEVDVMKKKLDLDQQREKIITDRELMKMQLRHLNTLLQKNNLSSEEEKLKETSDNENSQLGFNSFNLNEYDEWEERVVQQNRQLKDIFTELLITQHMSTRDHPTRATRRYRDRQREQGHARLMEDYFVDNPTYDEVIFPRRFRMRKPLFLRIVSTVTANNRYFQQRCDATGRKGLSPLQKCTGAMRVLAYGTSAYVHDEYLRMSETVTRDALVNFFEGIISYFGEMYLRRPNQNDLARLLYVGEERGFPGMIGSIDCMHWEWKNCPIAWAGQYAGRSGKTTIILEVVVSYDLWIWHASFGTPGSCNDINVLHRSPIFSDVLAGRAPNVSYVVNGRERNMTYYLTDGIYPSWAAFVKSITAPQIRKHKLFAERQEAARKDVERAFGGLQACFAFLRRPCLVWDKDIMGKIMIACIIIHNMIVEDERDTYLHYYDPSEFLNDMPKTNN